MGAADSSRPFLTPRMRGTGIRPPANLHVIGLSQRGDRHQRVNSSRWKNEPAPHGRHCPAGRSGANSRLVLRYGSQPRDTWRLQGCGPHRPACRARIERPCKAGATAPCTRRGRRGDCRRELPPGCGAGSPTRVLPGTARGRGRARGRLEARAGTLSRARAHPQTERLDPEPSEGCAVGCFASCR